MSNEKAFTSGAEAPFSTHNEKETIDSSPSPEPVYATGRRKSVALNLVENPLKRFTPEAAVLDAQGWAEQHGMSEYAALFGRAALVARAGENFESVTELDEPERAALIATHYLGHHV